MPSTLERLCSWYSQKCNGDWEHSYGVSIDTLTIASFFTCLVSFADR